MKRRLLLLALALAACVPPDGSQPQYGGGAPPPPQAAPPPAALSCMQLFGCFAGCNADGACIQSCQGQADPTAQAAAGAVMQCGAAKCQNESACVQRECRAELDACSANQVAQAPPPPQAPAPAPAPVSTAAPEMHAAELVKEFESNEVYAAQTYVGRRLRLHGTVNSIEYAKDGRIMLTFKSSITTYNNARCYFGAEQASRVGALRANETATVEGTVRGWEAGFGGAKTIVMLEECVVP